MKSTAVCVCEREITSTCGRIYSALIAFFETIASD